MSERTENWFDSHEELLYSVSRTLWEHPEGSEQEYQSCALLKS